ncbi:phosphatidylinositol mannoside acyltransferase [Pengzhenrongella frigida]|uniref:Phosphatidylinositol mannoside acyltransferase n=1 Tax=Pengzhenrongella frigida TaxID=1259133 RepID=A0A4Q5N712_9MICO|nr:phosphatidylinositol mannoside acyltransferase [Cellulomonas sp. HLT2-17]RYV52837.1 phosphatidylinositol mannoside acyltransferase [Cellulomonas sp. HLT2-17]
MNAGRAFAFAWRVAGHLPDPVLRAVTTIGADAAWLLRGEGVRQLERNLARVRPTASRRELRRLVRAGMRSYLRYYGEAFAVRSFTPAQVAARVRTVGTDPVRADLAANRTVLMALGHLGNWDLAGAYATVHLGPVTTVAERLEPEELFQEFLEFRQGLGMTIIALDETGGGDVFRQLVRVARGGPTLLPLLADRDLTRHGVEIDLFGERARVAAGPAALAVATGAMLVPTTVYYERLSGARRRAAGSPWGIVLDFGAPVTVPTDLPRAERIVAVTQAWVDVVAAGIATHPQDWHMLQKVFIADLDPARYAASLAKAPGGAS